MPDQQREDHKPLKPTDDDRNQNPKVEFPYCKCAKPLNMHRAQKRVNHKQNKDEDDVQRKSGVNRRAKVTRDWSAPLRVDR